MAENAQSFFQPGFFNEESQRGQRARDNPRSILPRTTRGSSKVADTLLNALLGVQGGIQAAQGTAGAGSPLLSFLSGAAGAVGAPRVEDIRAQRDAQQQQLLMQQMESLPVDQVSPDLVKGLKDLDIDISGIPLGVVNKLSPVFKEISDIRQQRRATEAAERQSGLQAEEGLRKELTGVSKDFRTVRDSYARVLASADDPSAAGDLALIFNYMKILDPGSVVRESEFANAQNAAGVPEQLRAQYNRVLRGERLSDVTRADFVNRADRLFTSQLQVQRQTEAEFRRIAEASGARPEAVIQDQFVPDRQQPLRRMGKPPGFNQSVPLISTDGGKTWRTE